jgi:hypothetical protein
MKYFWKILMDVYKFARGIIALIVLMFITTFIWSMYYVSKTVDESRHAHAVVGYYGLYSDCRPCERCRCCRCSCGCASSPYRGGL